MRQTPPAQRSGAAMERWRAAIGMATGSGAHADGAPSYGFDSDASGLRGQPHAGTAALPRG